MKVTMIAAPFGQRGQMHIHCRRYVRLLQLAACSIALIDHSGARSAPPADIERFNYPRRMRRLDGLVTTRALSFIHKRRLQPLLQSTRPDLFHVQWVDDRILDVDLAGGRPLVATAWGSDLNVPAGAPPDDPARRRIGAALRALDLLIVDCDDIVETARTLAGTQVPTALLPIGIDTNLFRPDLPAQRRQWREQLRIEADAVVYLSARQLGALYRPGEIIRAFASMPAAAREKSYLIIRTFGHSVGTSISDLQQLAQELGIAQRVRWVGSMAYEEQPGLYAAADLTLNFPQMDAFPVTILESLACGIPVLTNRLKAYESNGVRPYLTFAAEDSVAQLGVTMARALADLQGLQTLAATGRAHIVQNFDERVSAVQLRQIYESLLDRLRRPSAATFAHNVNCA
jgi:glycosyltransferase involved in cell wall biosynthesis